MRYDSSYSSFVTTLAYQEGSFQREKLVALRTMPRPGDLVTCIVDDAADYFEVVLIEHSSHFNEKRSAFEAGGVCIHAKPITKGQRSAKLKMSNERLTMPGAGNKTQ
ncbi:MAG: hypothetical protein F6K47_09135 [Symploca sp. SIO2E6]|nr:hypothetical protein [Symploca sp. SIO2E6]